jgi:Na+-transporting NADH:ubiquinone oxidoreductase subunit NqrB
MIAPVLQWALGGVMLVMQAANVPWAWQVVIDGLTFLIFFMGILEIAVQRPISQ